MAANPEVDFKNIWGESYRNTPGGSGFAPQTWEEAVPVLEYMFKTNLNVTPRFREKMLEFPRWLNKTGGSNKRGIATTPAEFAKQMLCIVRFLKYINQKLIPGKPLGFEDFYADEHDPGHNPKVTEDKILQFNDEFGHARAVKTGKQGCNTAIRHFYEFIYIHDKKIVQLTFGKGGIQTSSRQEGTAAERKFTYYNEELQEFWNVLWRGLYPPKDYVSGERREQIKPGFGGKRPSRFIPLYDLYYRLLLCTAMRPTHAEWLAIDTILSPKATLVEDAYKRRFFVVPFREIFKITALEESMRKNAPGNLYLTEDLYQRLVEWSRVVQSEGKRYIFGDYFNPNSVTSAQRERRKKESTMFPMMAKWNRIRVERQERIIDKYVPENLRHCVASAFYTITKDQDALNLTFGWESGVGVEVYSKIMQKNEAVDVVLTWGIFIPKDKQREADDAMSVWLNEKILSTTSAYGLPSATMLPQGQLPAAALQYPGQSQPLEVIPAGSAMIPQNFGSVAAALESKIESRISTMFRSQDESIAANRAALEEMADKFNKMQKQADENFNKLIKEIKGKK